MWREGDSDITSRDVDFILHGHLALFDCTKPHPSQEARQREAQDESSRSRRTGSQYNSGPSKSLKLLNYWLLDVVQASLNPMLQPTNTNLQESGWSTLRGKAF